MSDELTHINPEGEINMVDVGHKQATRRSARARGRITMKPEVFQAITEGRIAKGNVLTTAKIAGIMAAKNTAQTIPLCHPLPITHVDVEFFPDPQNASIEAQATVQVNAQTGVEMEALHAVSVSLLTIYDMAKAMDKTMVISDIRLMEKSGGKSGLFQR